MKHFIFFFYLVLKHVDGERLVLNQVQRTDMGGYLCIASNGVPPSVSKRFEVKINCKLKNPNNFVFYFFKILPKLSSSINEPRRKSMSVNEQGTFFDYTYNIYCLIFSCSTYESNKSACWCSSRQ